MQRLPNLAPAPHKPEPPAPPQPQQPQTARPRVARASSSRKYATNHAYVPCRKTKTKCDGRQPCARCQFRSNVCTYDTKVLSGETLNRLTNAVNE
ncbi:hypothetical protein FVEG_03208 [Fusarium verticillioides 7600]|uniref:Zn(2)-C6 fungal-type domain-containing protein n=1 Tax=Gibberella moniliformis (strain M3125 / FGSC 7600) TaxID=334819 RepID=W7M7X8_GIBM7|nr:hypothetical protein FVEG_03208 [Fusarium verticillioides 7600]EWG41007.1 hypothetical protein FVEG_03208 [Fusarium verticillioides 7600]